MDVVKLEVEVNQGSSLVLHDCIGSWRGERRRQTSIAAGIDGAVVSTLEVLDMGDLTLNVPRRRVF